MDRSVFILGMLKGKGLVHGAEDPDFLRKIHPRNVKLI